MPSSSLAFAGAPTATGRPCRLSTATCAASQSAPRGSFLAVRAVPTHFRLRAPPASGATSHALRRRPVRASAVAAGRDSLDHVRRVGVTILSLGLTIAAELCASRALSAAGVTFPGSLAAMLTLLFAITALRALRLKRAAEGLRGLFAPGATFLARWLAVFFVPNLVMLPLAPRLPGADLAKITIILIAGLVASLLSTAAAALALRTMAANGGDRDVSSAAVIPAKPSPPSRRLVGALFLGAVAALPVATASVAPQIAVILYALCVTLLAFCVGQRVPRLVRTVVHPLVSCTLGALGGVALLSLVTGTPFNGVLAGYYVRGAGTAFSTWGAGNVLAALLGPAVVSFAIQMDGRRALMRQRGGELVGTALIATVAGLFGTAGAARALGMSHGARLMVVPRMITAPLAMAIVDMLGAEAGVAMSVVALTGLLGANIAAPLLSMFGVKDPVVRGLATGAAAHGLGTAAMADEPAAFPFAALAMTLVGIFSTCFVALPPVRALLLRVALGAAVVAK